MTPRFAHTDFSDRFNPLDRSEHLPRLARIAWGLTGTNVNSLKAKRIAVKIAEEALSWMRARVDVLEAQR